MLLLPCASEVFPAVPTPLPEILSLTFQRIRHESDPGSTRIPDRLVSDPAGTACGSQGQCGGQYDEASSSLRASRATLDLSRE